MKITTLGKKHLSMLLLILSLCIYLKGFTQTSLTVEDIFGSEKYDTHTLKGVQWVPHEDAFSFIDRDNDHLAIMKFDIKTQKSIVLINSKKSNTQIQDHKLRITTHKHTHKTGQK